MKYLMTCLLLCGSLLLSAQHSFRAKVLDEETDLPLEGVNVFVLDNQNIGTTTNRSGAFQLNVPRLPANVVFSYLGYRTDTLLLTSQNLSMEVVTLKANIFQLPSIEVSAQMELLPVTRPKHSVLDFSLWNDYVVYIRYIGQKKSLVLTDLDGSVLFEKELDLKGIQKLHRSCLGNLHLVTATKGVELHIQNDKISLGKAYNRKYYELYLEPCVAGLEKEIILRYEKDLGLRTTFIKARKDANGSKVIYRVADQDKLQTYYEKYRLIHSEGNNSINMLDIQHGDFKRAQRAEFERDFYRKIFLKGIEIPLIAMEDSLAIFDFIRGSIVYTNLDGRPTSLLPIDFHLNKDWDKKVIYDAKTKKLFASFRKPVGRFIAEVDPHTGKCRDPYHLPTSLVKKIDIHNGQVFLLQSEPHLSYWTLYRVQLKQL